MKIESNLSAVITRVNRLKTQDIPAALRLTLTPARWQEPAAAEAQAVLEALASPEQRAYIPDFLRTLKSGVFGNGFCLRLRSPFGAAGTVADYQAARGALSPKDGPNSLFLGQVTKFEELMAEWVGLEKDKDQRDEGKTDEEIGEWIAYEMLAPDGGHLVRAGKNKGRPVREVFMPHIVDFLNRKATGSRLDAATVDAWLRAVLAAWRRRVRDQFPHGFKTALREQRAAN